MHKLYKDYTTIDWSLSFKSIKKESLYHQLALWFVITLIGICAGVSAAWIDIADEMMSDFKRGFCRDVWYLNRKFCCYYQEEDQCTFWSTYGSYSITQYVMFVFCGTVMAAASAFLVKAYAPYASGSGIPEVKTILGGFVIRGFLGVWTLIIKCVGLVLSVGSGLVLGKEGPLVHVCSCFGNIIARRFEHLRNDEVAKREILSASAAAGVSVAFGSPIGGVLFALEEVSTYFSYREMWRSFVCAMVSTVTLQMMNPYRTNQLVLFQVVYDRAWHQFELVWFIFIGVLGGLWGALFTHFNVKIQKLRRQYWKDIPVIEVAAIATITGAVGYMNFFSRVSMSELVAQLFTECEKGDFGGLCQSSSQVRVVFSLVFVAVLKMVLVCVTFGARIPAGIFIPSMTIGACVGRVIGIIVKSVQEAHPEWQMFSSCVPGTQCVTPGTYALIGAAASLAGVTRMTVSLVVITFELTGALTYVIPLMLSIMAAKWVADSFGKGGIYEKLIQFNSFPYLDHKVDYLDDSRVHEVMNVTLILIKSYGETIESLNEILDSTDEPYQGYPVVNSNGLLIGYVTSTQLQNGVENALRDPSVTKNSLCLFLPKSKGAVERTDSPLIDMLDQPSVPMQPVAQSSLSFADLVDTSPVTLQPNSSMDIALELFKKLGLRYILVVEKGILHGILTKKDLIMHLNNLQPTERSMLPSFNRVVASDQETATVNSADLLFEQDLQ